jgi:hypothetical protein
MRGTKVEMASYPFDLPVDRAFGARRLCRPSMRLCTGVEIFVICAEAGVDMAIARRSVVTGTPTGSLP